VRIFLGLKGTGTMWVDMVNFEYSASNLNLYETCQPMFDSIMPPYSYLVPQPHKVTDYSAEELRNNMNDVILDPCIVLPLNPGDAVRSAGMKLANALGTALRNKSEKNYTIRIINTVVERTLESGRLIFSIGKTGIYNQYARQLPLSKGKLRPQMYSIHRLPGMKRVIFIDAADAEGFSYAYNTLVQLIDSKNEIYNHYNITDYPDFETRGVVLPIPAEKRDDRKAY
jgi:hypothetical protein